MSEASVQLVETAKRLRLARGACRQFLALWAAQSRADLLTERALRKAFSDPNVGDWSVLYDCNDLDD